MRRRGVGIRLVDRTASGGRRIDLGVPHRWVRSTGLPCFAERTAPGSGETAS